MTGTVPKRVGGAGRIRSRRSPLRAGTPRAREITASRVVLTWTAPKGRKPWRYRVERDGKVLAAVKKGRFADLKVVPGKRHRYRVTALDAKRKKIGLRSKELLVRVPRRPAKKPATTARPGTSPAASQNPQPLLAPVGPPAGPPADTRTRLSAAMVDRVFWRAGFGALSSDRTRWADRPVEELVDWMLDTQPSFASSVGAPKSNSGAPIDPLASDDELLLEWIERMARADNPLPERLTLILHGLWAVSNEDGIPLRFMVTYRDRLRRFANLAADPNASFRDLALEMTIADPAMSRWLNQNQNTRYGPNENYARELMELFCLGITDANGTANYTQNDVAQLARALTGWRLNENPDSPSYGAITFSQNHFATGNKTLSFAAAPVVSAVQGVDAVLAHPAHARYLVRRLWTELVGGSIPADTLDALASQYRSTGFRLRPLVRGILLHPALIADLDAPALPKAPAVFAAGVVRAIGAPLRGGHLSGSLSAMGQRPFRPPNVAGWEGGLSWFNTNAVQARFDLTARVQWLKHSNHYDGVERRVAVVAGETPAAAFERAYDEAGRPWLAPATRAALLTVAAALPVTNDNQRRQRFYTLQTLILGGPDGQVC